MFINVNRNEIIEDEKFTRGLYETKECSIEEFWNTCVNNLQNEGFDIYTDVDRRKRYFPIFASFDTETSKVYFHPDDVYYENPLTECPKGLKLKDIRRIDYVYMWQFSFAGTIGYGRHIREFAALIEYIEEQLKDFTYGTKKKYPIRLKMFGFNSPYDLMFVKNFFPNAEPFIGSTPSEAISWNLTPNIEFLDAQALVGNQSLKRTLEDYNIFIPKDGINHDIFRSPDTPLTDIELGYALDDVYYLDKFIENKLEMDKDIYSYVGDLPYTKTQEVVAYMDIVKTEKAEISYEDALKIFGKKLLRCDKKLEYKIEYKGKKIWHNGKVWYFKKVKDNKKPFAFTKWAIESDIIKKRVGQNLNNREGFEEEYDMLRKAFSGGFTHANVAMLGRIVNNVVCTDLSSAYPSEMLTQKFVYAYDEIVDNTDFYDPNTRTITNDKYGYLLDITIKNLKPKRSFGAISKHKCDDIDFDEDNSKFFEENKYDCIEYDNGRVMRAKYLTLHCLDIDINNWSKIYDWDKIIFHKVRRGKKYYLSDTVISTICHFYDFKCEYKTLEAVYKNDPEKYAYYHAKLTLSKQKLNSVYGLSVKDRRRFKVDEQLKLPNQQYTYEELLENFYNKECKYNTLLPYAIGPQVTAYSRRRIFDVVSKIPDDKFVYSDTDSIYYINDEAVNKAIKDYNVLMRADLDASFARNHIDYSKWYKDEAKTKEAFPSKYDIDDPVDGFCTTGAKRYIKFDFLEDGDWDVHATIAGVSKQVARDFFKKHASSIYECRNLFVNKFFIPTDESKKKVHRYVNNDKIRTLTLPDGCVVEFGSYVSLFDTSFEISYTSTMIRVFKLLLKK